MTDGRWDIGTGLEGENLSAQGIRSDQTIGYGDIVVAVAGSDTDHACLAWAIDHARRTGARLRICHVHTSSQLTSTVWGAADQELVRAQARLEAAVEKARQDLPREQVRGELRLGEVVTELLSVAQDASLLVMGTRGFFWQAEPLIGSTALRVATHCPCPVLVARCMLSGDGGLFPRHVVVGVDGDAATQAVLGFGFRYAAAHELPLAVVWASSAWPDDLQPTACPQPWFSGESVDQARLASWTAPWEQRYPTVPVTRSVISGRPLPGLLRASSTAALLVVGARRRTCADQEPLGPVAHGVISHATCPVAVVRPSGGVEPAVLETMAGTDSGSGASWWDIQGPRP